MNHKEQEFEWQELRDIWANSYQTKRINIQVLELLDELKGKSSQFERDSIMSDIDILKANWEQTKNRVSQFEKDSINRDLRQLSGLLKRFFNLFRKDS